MDCMEAIATRRSIRKFTDEIIDQAVLEAILEAGRMAPTAGNLQPCYFVVVKDQEMKKNLQAAAFDQESIADGSVVIAVCADPERSSKYGDIGRTKWCLLDCANATQNMLLAAHANGYGACWIGGFSEKKVKKLLELPDDFRVVSLIPIGRAAENPAPPERRPLQDLVRWEKW